MTQHSQRAQRGPSTASLVRAWAGVGASFSATIWLIIVLDRPTAQAVVGVGLGAVLSGIVFQYAWDRQVEREMVKVRIHRERERATRTAERAEVARTSTIATWTGEAIGQRFSVRYDASTGYLMVQGWMGDYFQVPRESPWFNVASLKETIVELEATHELVPESSPGMDAVRQRLGLLTSPSALRPVGVPLYRDGGPVAG